MRVVAKKINDPYCNYITKSKVYETISVDKYGFEIKDDTESIIYCGFKGCPHIDESWTIIGNPAIAVKDEKQ